MQANGLEGVGVKSTEHPWIDYTPGGADAAASASSGAASDDGVLTSAPVIIQFDEATGKQLNEQRGFKVDEKRGRW